MDYDTVPAAEFGQSLQGLGLNLLVRDVLAEATFLTAVFGMKAHRASRDFAIMLYGTQVFQLHSDTSYAAHALPSLLPESGPRGGGIELRLYESDPDHAVLAAADFPDAVVLAEPKDKRGHGLREAVILCANGYAWVPSKRLQS